MATLPRETREYAPPALMDRALDLTRINLEVVAFVGLVLISIITHFWALGHMALHHDELIHAWTSWRIYTGAGSFTCAAGRTWSTYCYDPVYHGPSLYILTLLSYFLFGDGEAQARIPEAMAGIGLVASAWMLRPYLGRYGTFIAATLLALTPTLLYFTRFARHDALLLLWTFWMVLGFFRYLDTGRARYLYLLAAGTALAMATHELYYILFFLFGVFVLIRVLSELLPRRRLMIGLGALLAVAFVIMAVNPAITPTLHAGGLALLIVTVLGMGLLLTRVWGNTPIVTTRARVLWQEQRNVLWTALAILAAIYVLLFSVFFTDPRGIVDGLYQGLAYWLGSQHAYQRADQPWYYYLMQMPLYEPLALFTSIGATIYLLTRRAPTADHTPPTTPSTSLRTGDHQLDEADDEEHLSASEILEEIDGEVAEDAETQKLHRVEWVGEKSAVASEGELGDHAQVLTSDHAIAVVSGDWATDGSRAIFPLFLAFWFVGIFIALSWAGEKMPWLVTHIALPGNLLAAWALARLGDTISRRLSEARESGAQRPWLTILLIPAALALLLVALSVALWRLSSPGEGQQGQASLLQGLIPLAIVGALIYGILTLGQSIGTRVTLALCGLTIAGLLGLYMIRATWMVVYDHPDTPSELLVYTQSSPDVPLIVQNIRELAISQTRNRRSSNDPVGGHSMPVIMDSGGTDGEGSLAWPYQWYLRDFQRVENRNADFFRDATGESFMVPVDNAQPDGEKEYAPVVMIHVPHMTEATRQALEENYVRKYASKLNWWFPEGHECSPDSAGYKRFYFNSWTSLEELTAPLASRRPTGCGADIAAKLQAPWAPLVWPLRPENWQTLKDYLIYRKLPEPLRLDGREMEVWVRRDLASTGTLQEGGSSSGTFKLVAQEVISGPGSEQGQLDQPRGIAVGSQGNVYVADTGNNRIEVFGPDGKLIRAIGTFGSGEGQFFEPRGVAVDGQGNIYVADTWNARVVKLDPDGKVLKSWGEGKQDFGEGRRATTTDGTAAGNAAEPLGFFGPRGIAVDGQGNVYIADTGNKRIVVTDSEGNYRYQWGYGGAEPGAFNEPVGVAVDGQGNVYVADIWNGRVQMFAPAQEGQVSAAPLATWRITGWQPNTYDDPSIAASGDGQVFVSVPSRNLVVQTNNLGEVLLRWGGKGNDVASLTLPSGAAVGPDGSVYVVDRGNNRIMRFKLPQQLGR